MADENSQKTTVGDVSGDDHLGCAVLGIFLLIGWAVVAFLFPESWEIRYAARYWVSWNNVTIDVKPTDCNFLHAPIGGKSCHYDKVISKLYWAMSTTNHPIVSYDDKKTWSEGEPGLNIKVPSTVVYVSWNKVEAP